MTGHYIHTAWLNMRRSPWLTALIVLAIAVGIGSSMTVYSLLHAMSRDPIPRKSAQLYAPRLDTVGPALRQRVGTGRGPGYDGPGFDMTYRDATALRDMHLGRHQAVMYGGRMVVAAVDGVAGSRHELVRATDVDFFAMFEVPFLQDGKGGPWSAAQAAAGAHVAVLTEARARNLFGTADVVGRTILLDGYRFLVVGVAGNWNPQPRFYDLGGDTYGGLAQMFGVPDQIFIPLNAATALIQGALKANSYCLRAPLHPPGRTRYLYGECQWLQLWVELPTAADVRRFEQRLREYAKQQHREGRFDFEPGTRLLDVREAMRAYKVAPDTFRIANVLAFCFLGACLLNAIALMMGRFRSRAVELELRRALGASRRSLFAQCLTEAAIIGALGGAVGLALTAVEQWLAHRLLSPTLAQLLVLDSAVVALAVGLAVGGALLAGLYPAWQASRARRLARSVDQGQGRAGAALVALQVATTLAILANALDGIRQSLDFRSTGADEAGLFAIPSAWQRELPDLPARLDRDLRALRTLPGVVDATAANPPSVPDIEGVPMVIGGGESTSSVNVSLHFVDEYTENAWGVRRVAGRWFEREEIGTGFHGSGNPVVVNKALADLFPGGRALDGTLVYSDAAEPWQGRVVGVIDMRPGRGVDSRYLAFLPRLHAPGGTVLYMVRARPDELQAAKSAAESLLLRIDDTRILSVLTPLGMRSGAASFGEISDDLQQAARGMALALALTCSLLLLVNALGIFGLTSYWVLRRRGQIGVRRALGAQRAHILRHFLGENLVIVAAGVGLGIALTVAGNLAMVKLFQVQPIPLAAVAGGALLIIVISQLAVLWPAVRAARIPPAVATRAE